MKTITIDVPRTGATIQFLLRPGAASGQATIVTSDELEVRLTEPAPASTVSLKPDPSANSGKAPNPKTSSIDLDGIHKRLIKLNPSTRDAAVNCIKAMFQLTAPITDEAANKFLQALRRRGSLTINSEGKIDMRRA
jgi:hypothetical protein